MSGNTSAGAKAELEGVPDAKAPAAVSTSAAVSTDAAAAAGQSESSQKQNSRQRDTTTLTTAGTPLQRPLHRQQRQAAEASHSQRLPNTIQDLQRQILVEEQELRLALQMHDLQAERAAANRLAVQMQQSAIPAYAARAVPGYGMMSDVARFSAVAHPFGDTRMGMGAIGMGMGMGTPMGAMVPRPSYRPTPHTLQMQQPHVTELAQMQMMNKTIQAMNASEGSFMQLQYLFGVYRSLPLSYRAALNQSQRSRQDFVALLGNKRKEDCMVLLRDVAPGFHYHVEEGAEGKRRKIDISLSQQGANPSSSPAERKKQGYKKAGNNRSWSNEDTLTGMKVGANKKKRKRWTWSKKPGAPRRPLSAYNIFFSEERGRILKELGAATSQGNEELTAGSTGTVEGGAADGAAAGAGPGQNAFNMLINRRLDSSGQSGLGRRGRHVRTHGKIGFRDLAKQIAKRWKELLPGELDEYKRLAEIDRKRYVTDMEKWTKEQETLDAAKTLNGLGARTA